MCGVKHFRITSLERILFVLESFVGTRVLEMASVVNLWHAGGKIISKQQKDYSDRAALVPGTSSY